MNKEIKELETELDGVKKEIRAFAETVDAETDVEALESRTAELETKKAEIEAKLEAAIEAEKEARAKVISGQGKKIPIKKETKDMEYTIDSKEYRSAWFKRLAGRQLNDVEQRAITTGLTDDQSVLIPTTVQNEIWDLVSGEHSILADLNTIRANTVIDIPVHTASSGASKPGEAAAPDEETNTFAKITLSGVDYAKYVEISYAMRAMSIPAFESYIITEISKAIGELMAEDAVANITSAIATDNQFSGVSYANLASAFGAIKRANGLAIYATRSTIYGSLIGMVDSNGNPIFQQPAAGAPLGSIWGAPLKVEDAVDDGTLLIGDGSKAVNAVVQDIMIESDQDIKTHSTIISGYARAEVALVDSEAFAVITASVG